MLCIQPHCEKCPLQPQVSVQHESTSASLSLWGPLSSIRKSAEMNNWHVRLVQGPPSAVDLDALELSRPRVWTPARPRHRTVPHAEGGRTRPAQPRSAPFMTNMLLIDRGERVSVVTHHYMPLPLPPSISTHSIPAPHKRSIQNMLKQQSPAKCE